MNEFWDEVTSEILGIRQSKNDRHLIVGVDGVDGAGKTTFAEKLLEMLNVTVGSKYTQLVSIDDFHNVREVRHRLGRGSPLGFFEDSFDYEKFKNRVLIPVRDSNGNSVRIIPGSHDLDSDLLINPKEVQLEPFSVVIIEGIFLHRDEIFDFFDFSIFLDIPFSESVRRMSNRDGSDPNPDHPSMSRYVEGQRIYLERCNPRSRASLVIDNSDYESPRVGRL